MMMTKVLVVALLLVSSLSAKMSDECYNHINKMGSTLAEKRVEASYLNSLIALDVCVAKTEDDVSVMNRVFNVAVALEHKLIKEQ